MSLATSLPLRCAWEVSVCRLSLQVSFVFSFQRASRFGTALPPGVHFCGFRGTRTFEGVRSEKVPITDSSGTLHASHFDVAPRLRNRPAAQRYQSTKPYEASMILARKTFSTLLLIVSTLTPVAWAADAYPSKAVRWIVAYAPGGGSDVLARTVGEQLSTQIGQPVVVDNRPGGATIIG